MKHKILSVLLSLAMVLTLLPATAMATDEPYISANLSSIEELPAEGQTASVSPKLGNMTSPTGNYVATLRSGREVQAGQFVVLSSAIAASSATPIGKENTIPETQGFSSSYVTALKLNVPAGYTYSDTTNGTKNKVDFEVPNGAVDNKITYSAQDASRYIEWVFGVNVGINAMSVTWKRHTGTDNQGTTATADQTDWYIIYVLPEATYGADASTAKYARDLASALTSAAANDTITLLKDVTLSSDATLDANKKLNTNGHTLTVDSGTLTVRGTVTGGGKLVMKNNTTLAVQSASLLTSTTALEVNAGATMTVGTSTFIGTASTSSVTCGSNLKSGKVVLTSDSLTVEAGSEYVLNANFYESTATVNVAGTLQIGPTTAGHTFEQGSTTITLTASGAKVVDKRETKTTPLAVYSSDGGVADSNGDVTYSYYVMPYIPVYTPSTTTTETATNSDGSTTTTTKSSDGTTTTTTKAADGSTTETVAKPDGSTTTTTKATDGSTTEAVINADGSSKVTEKAADGSESVVETAKDGSVTESGKDANGTTATAKIDADGNLTEAKADVTAATVANAVKNDEPVTLPVEVPSAATAAEAAPIAIAMPSTVTAENPVKVEIPVENVTAGTVVVLVHEDGTEEVVKTCVQTEDGVALTVDGDVTVKVVENAKTFTDEIPTWFEEEVAFVSSREIFNGMGDGTFSYATPMNNGMIMQVLFNLEGAEAPEGESFADAEGQWFDDAANWGASLGLTKPDADGNFNGYDVCERENLVLALYQYAQAKGYDVSASTSLENFTDAGDISDEALAAMQWAVAVGIVKGSDVGLEPNGPVTRGQMAAMVARFINNVVG